MKCHFLRRLNMATPFSLTQISSHPSAPRWLRNTSSGRLLMFTFSTLYSHPPVEADEVAVPVDGAGDTGLGVGVCAVESTEDNNRQAIPVRMPALKRSYAPGFDLCDMEFTRELVFGFPPTAVWHLKSRGTWRCMIQRFQQMAMQAKTARFEDETLRLPRAYSACSSNIFALLLILS